MQLGGALAAVKFQKTKSLQVSNVYHHFFRRVVGRGGAVASYLTHASGYALLMGEVRGK